MDINEIADREILRHPWELSRTHSILWELRRFLTDDKLFRVCIDLGAGDQFFDDAILSEYPDLHVFAVDIGYTEQALQSLSARNNADRITSVVSLKDIPEQKADFALMMDSLEYMTDEVGCLRELASHIRPGGYLFLTLPACSFLESEHDDFVNSLRRYDKKYIHEILSKVPELERQEEHFFYSLLFPVRFAQRVLPVCVPPERQTINCWKYGKNHILTKTAELTLNVDYKMNTLLGKAKVDIPGLSLFIACKRV